MLDLIRLLIKLSSYIPAILLPFVGKGRSDPRQLVYTTTSGVQILVSKGEKRESVYDFKVLFRRPGGRLRTPKHIHLVVEMYVKHAYDSQLTMELRNHVLRVFDLIRPIDYFPPRLQVFRPEDAIPFSSLDRVGEFTVEFILAAVELIMIQEKTNYPLGSLTKSLYEDFGVRDRFSVIQKATLQKFRR